MGMTYDEMVREFEQTSLSREEAIELAELCTSTEVPDRAAITRMVELAAKKQPLPEDAPVIENAYIFGEDASGTTTYTEAPFFRTLYEEKFSPDREYDVVEKSIPGSNQQQREISNPDYVHTLQGDTLRGYVNPPYEAEALATLLELDPIHARAVEAKVMDTVGRGYNLSANRQVIPMSTTPAELPKYRDDAIPEAQVIAAIEEVKKMFKNSNPIDGFSGTLEKVATDRESIGYCAMEVVRHKKTNKVVRLVHVPAARIRVLENREGYVELHAGEHGPRTYYQVFGEKLRSSTRPDPVEPRKKAPYDPDLDGPIERATVNLVDRSTGEKTRARKNEANEIIFKVIHHPKTIYYGVPNIIPAVGYLLSNVEIREYFLQFFKNNTVPRYAIIVKGVRLDPKVIDKLEKYFTQEVQGSAHKTLFIPIPSMRGNVDIRFEKLDADAKEASFQDTSKNNDQKIMVAEGTPPAILGVFEAANLGSGKGSSQIEIYKDRIVDPRQRTWANCLTDLIRLGLGITILDFEFNPLDLRDRETMMKVSTGYVKAGVMNINEVRVKDNLGDPVPGGERNHVIISSGIQFVDEFPGMESSSEERLHRSEGGKNPGKPVDEDLNVPEREDSDNEG